MIKWTEVNQAEYPAGGWLAMFPSGWRARVYLDGKWRVYAKAYNQIEMEDGRPTRNVDQAKQAAEAAYKRLIVVDRKRRQQDPMGLPESLDHEILEISGWPDDGKGDAISVTIRDIDGPPWKCWTILDLGNEFKDGSIFRAANRRELIKTAFDFAMKPDNMEALPESIRLILDEQLSPAEAVFGFAAGLTTRKEPVTLGAAHDAAIAAELADEFCRINGLPTEGIGFDELVSLPESFLRLLEHCHEWDDGDADWDSWPNSAPPWLNFVIKYHDGDKCFTKKADALAFAKKKTAEHDYCGADLAKK